MTAKFPETVPAAALAVAGAKSAPAKLVVQRLQTHLVVPGPTGADRVLITNRTFELDVALDTAGLPAAQPGVGSELQLKAELVYDNGVAVESSTALQGGFATMREGRACFSKLKVNLTSYQLGQQRFKLLVSAAHAGVELGAALSAPFRTKTKMKPTRRRPKLSACPYDRPQPHFAAAAAAAPALVVAAPVVEVPVSAALVPVPALDERIRSAEAVQLHMLGELSKVRELLASLQTLASFEAAVAEAEAPGFEETSAVFEQPPAVAVAPLMQQ